MDHKFNGKLLETVAFSNECICFMELIQWEHTHFHPSGDCTPSSDDLEFTERVMRAGELLGIRLIDHIIVGGGDSFYSLREEGGFFGREGID